MISRSESGMDRRRAVVAYALDLCKNERAQQNGGIQKYTYLHVISIDPKRMGVSSSMMAVEMRSEQYQACEHLSRCGVAVSEEIAAGISGPLMSRIFRGSALAQIDFTDPAKAELGLNFLLGFNRRLLLEERKEGQFLSVTAPIADSGEIFNANSAGQIQDDEGQRFFLYPVPAKSSFCFGAAKHYLVLAEKMPDYLK